MAKEDERLESLPCSALKQKILCLGNTAVGIAKRLLWHSTEYISIHSASYIQLPSVSWQTVACVWRKGQNKAEAGSSSHFSSSLYCPLLHSNKKTFIFNYHFSFVTNGNPSFVISTIILTKPMLLCLSIENSMVAPRKHWNYDYCMGMDSRRWNLCIFPCLL